MSRTSVFTTITPLPTGITRHAVLETYHSHIEMIELNPLVVERFKCKPPNYAPAEEYYSTWWTIKDKVSYLPGGLATGSVSYHACFHDLPDGLQTHVYAPLGLDIRAKWSVGGNLPGEPKQPAELGLGIPREGLYIREDVKMKCNIMMMSFVKKTFKESHAKLVDRLVEKAHILESNVANERLKALKNVDPGERMGHGDIFIAPPPGYQPQNGHQSVYSNGSSSGGPVPSPGLSQSSTLTGQSEFPASPPSGYRSPPYQTAHYRSTSYPMSETRGSPQFFEEQSKGADDAGLTLLPATTYNPNQLFRRDEKSPQYNSYETAELPSEAPTPPPKDDKHRFAAELPA